jgi:hypothetical protein
MAERHHHSITEPTARDRRNDSTAGPRWRRWLPAAPARQSALAATAVLLVLAGTATATGGLSVGSILPADETPHPPEYRQADETVVALGTDPRVGSWRIVAYRSPELVDRGEVIQPAGLPCLKLALTDATSDTLIGTRSYCGERGKGGLAGASLPVEAPSGRVFTIIFGQAPEEAAGLEIVNSDGGVRRPAFHEGPEAIKADFWMDVIPRASLAEETWMRWIASDGRSAGERVDLTLELSQPLTPIRSGAG